MHAAREECGEYVIVADAGGLLACSFSAVQPARALHGAAVVCGAEGEIGCGLQVGGQGGRLQLPCGDVLEVCTYSGVP
jgi:hypothetical protein